jgi:hypothetical protein
MRVVSGGGAEVQAALFVELLRGAQIELVCRDRVAQTLAGNVAKRAVLPGVCGGKKHRSIASNENIWLDFRFGKGNSLGGGRAVLPRLVIRGSASCFDGFGCAFAVVDGLSVLGRSVVYVVRKERHVIAAAGEKRNKSRDELAVAILAVVPVRMRCGKVREIKTQPGNYILRAHHMAGTRGYMIPGACPRGANNDRTRARPHKTGGSSNRGVAARTYVSSCDGGRVHGNVRCRRSYRRASHAGHHSSTLCGSHRWNCCERNDCNQEAAHGEYLGSRAAGPFLHVHV